ncbi:T9SS type A sorting domain-containing protein [Bizionia saleffrena]|uniref:T9SS type A sorting domain-containing protein n=1 Tax=Bizionia saleffrena TaxID=291189 RepID=A0A8H2QIF1_9FLAO|nr:choice-of-anchor L domain-containing protein [Bizionia saleffrena]TYB70485.1 T9SS type A sorting domain-containing protein [Bizionia saleffrena]
MKKKILFIFLIICNYSFSQLTIDDINTTQQLIQDELVGNPNFPMSNLVVSTGVDFGEVNGVATFTANGADIAFAQGIVLSTGNVLSIPGGNTSVLSEGTSNWLGDSDLEMITGVSTSFNASVIQFDFLAQVESISFDFLMVSEEYGVFECSYADTFAVILTSLNTGVSVNLALVPNTTTPISILNVRGGANTSCSPENEAYFHRYNYEVTNVPANPDYILPADSPINFNGQTEVFELTGDLVIGDNYSFKIVVADASDSSYDSALFVKKNSFGAIPIMEQEPGDVVVEDTDNNGSSVFNLRDNETLMLGSVDTSIYTFNFNYYLTLLDAETGVNAISNPEAYTNTEDPETIYVSMENAFTGRRITNSFRISTDSALLSTKNFELEGLEIYPNPVIDKLFITNTKAIIKVEIYNMHGQLIVSQFSNDDADLIVDFENLANGLYFLKLESDKGTIYKRILK